MASPDHLLGRRQHLLQGSRAARDTSAYRCGERVELLSRGNDGAARLTRESPSDAEELLVGRDHSLLAGLARLVTQRRRELAHATRHTPAHVAKTKAERHARIAQAPDAATEYPDHVLA